MILKQFIEKWKNKRKRKINREENQTEKGKAEKNQETITIRMQKTENAHITGDGPAQRIPPLCGAPDRRRNER
jgi:hypothetical protein